MSISSFVKEAGSDSQEDNKRIETVIKVNDFVKCGKICLNSGAYNIGRNTASGIYLSACAELYQCASHSLATFGDSLELEIV